MYMACVYTVIKLLFILGAIVKLDIKPKMVLVFFFEILNGAYKDQLLVYRSLVVRFLKLGECTEVR